MSFTLNVKLTGLVLFVPHENGGKLLALIPDARSSQVTEMDPPPFADRRWYRMKPELRPRAHVGHLAFSSEALRGSAIESLPQTQVIHRLGKSRLSFLTGNEKDTLDESGLRDIAPIEEIAPGRGVSASALEPQATHPFLLSQILLDEGGFTHRETSGKWRFSKTLGGSGVTYDHLAVWTLWSTEVSRSTVKIRIQKPEAVCELELYPVGDSLDITIGATCCENPIDWPELGRTAESASDPDFRWFYTLLDPMPVEADLTSGHEPLLLPVPEIVVDGLAGSGSTCINGLAPRADFVGTGAPQNVTGK